MASHFLDTHLQTTCPTVMVPLHGEFAPLEKTGHRFLTASNGLWVEIRRPWLHLIWPVALQKNYPMPYGRLETQVELAFEKIPADLVAQFYRDAMAVHPTEFGAWLVWDERAKVLKYQPMQSIKAKVGILRPTALILKSTKAWLSTCTATGPYRLAFLQRMIVMTGTRSK